MMGWGRGEGRCARGWVWVGGGGGVGGVWGVMKSAVGVVGVVGAARVVDVVELPGTGGRRQTHGKGAAGRSNKVQQLDTRRHGTSTKPCTDYRQKLLSGKKNVIKYLRKR